MNDYGENHVTMGIMKSANHPHVHNDASQSLIQTTHHHILTKKQLGHLSRVIHQDYHKMFGRVLGPINPSKHYMLTNKQLDIADNAVRELDHLRRKESTDPRINPPMTDTEKEKADNRHHVGHMAAYAFRQNVYENLGLRHDIPQPGKNFYSAEFFTDTVILWLHSFPKIYRDHSSIMRFWFSETNGNSTRDQLMNQGLFVLGDDLMTQVYIMELAAKCVGNWRKNNAVIDSTFFDPNDTTTDEAEYVLALNYLQNCEALAGDYYIYNTPPTDENYKWFTSDAYLKDYAHNPEYRGDDDIPQYIMERDIRDPSGRVAALWRNPDHNPPAVPHRTVMDWNGHPFAADYQGYGMYDQAGGYGVFRPTSYQVALTNYATWKADAYRKQQAAALEKQQLEQITTTRRRMAAQEQKDLAFAKSDAAQGIDGRGWYDENGNLTAYIECPDKRDPDHPNSDRLVDARNGYVIGIERRQENPLPFNQWEFEPAPTDPSLPAPNLTVSGSGLVAKTVGNYLILASPYRDEDFNLTVGYNAPKYYMDPSFVNTSDYFGPGKLRVLGIRSTQDKGICYGVSCGKVWVASEEQGQGRSREGIPPPPEGTIVAYLPHCNGVMDDECGRCGVIQIRDYRVQFDQAYELVMNGVGYGEYYSRPDPDHGADLNSGTLVVYTNEQGDLLLPDGTVLGTLRQDDPTSPEITHDQITRYLGLPPWSSRAPSPPDTNSFGNSLGAEIKEHNGDSDATSCSGFNDAMAGMAVGGLAGAAAGYYYGNENEH